MTECESLFFGVARGGDRRPGPGEVVMSRDSQRPWKRPSVQWATSNPVAVATPGTKVCENVRGARPGARRHEGPGADATEEGRPSRMSGRGRSGREGPGSTTDVPGGVSRRECAGSERQRGGW